MQDFWFEIVDEYSDRCGEEFFVQEETEEDAWKVAKKTFPGEKLDCYGPVSEVEAEIMGLDTY